MTEAIIKQLEQVLGEKYVVQGEALAEKNLNDWSGYKGEKPLLLLYPQNTHEVSEVLKICNQHKQPIVVQGGLTGLAGGATPRKGEVAISLERLNKIEEVDVVSGTMTVQAGATLQQVQERAEDEGLYFPLDLGARGSCTIGGNLAVNAGGNRVIKYGMTRDQVLDLEAVLADGSIVGGTKKMIKNNTGLDLRNLMIGSEGSLGIITRAVLRLRQKPQATALAWCGLDSYDAVTRLLAESHRLLPAGPSVFEVVWPSFYDYVASHVKTVSAPLETKHQFYVLLESLGVNDEQHTEAFQSFLEMALEQGIIENAALAMSESDIKDFWDFRDSPAEFPVLMPNLIAFDISFSIADLGLVAQELQAILQEKYVDAITLFYGHLGDGNLHLIVDVADYSAERALEVEDTVYKFVIQYNGSISAEHGVGQKKKSVLALSRSETDISVMRMIKNSLDPNNILNPSRVYMD